ncbi:MAG: glycoside hydrolase family 3 N-terminal domain-containing protein [Acidimicrobiales bacterium]
MARDLDALVATLDLDEKAALLAGADLWSTVAVPRVGLPSVRVTDGPNGARGPALPAGLDAGPPMTSLCMPSGAALGATWDAELLERVGTVIGAEARLKACRVLLAPTVNLHRSPLGGRNFESYSEDPLLAGRLGAAFVRGAQAAGVACTVKHFAGNESEDGRMIVDTVADERTLRELHLLPFELAVREGGALGVMTSYNRLNGEYCADSVRLLAGVLRGDWGFDGFVVSDWFAFADTVPAIHAGLDLEMPGRGRAYGSALATAVRSGLVDEALVDAAVRRLLGVFDRLGALDDDPAEPRSDDLPEHRAVARDAATSAMVLLRNEGVLPLAVADLRRVAVIGPNAARAVIMGGGSASLPVPELRTPLAALRDRLGPGVEVVHEPGVDICLTTPEIPGDWLRAEGEPGMLVECSALDDPGGTVVHAERMASGSVVWFGPPADAGPEFSWRATAELTVAEPGRWTLSLVQTEPTRLLVDGEIVLDGTTADLPAGHDFFGLAPRADHRPRAGPRTAPSPSSCSPSSPEVACSSGPSSGCARPCRPTRWPGPSPPPREPTRSWWWSAPTATGSPKATTATRWPCPATRTSSSSGSSRWHPTPSSCSTSGRRWRCRGPSAAAPCCSAGSAGSSSPRPWPTSCSARPSPAAASPPPSRAGCRTTPPGAASPPRAVASATARGSWSATGGTSPVASRWPSPSATDSPTAASRSARPSCRRRPSHPARGSRCASP